MGKPEWMYEDPALPTWVKKAVNKYKNDCCDIMYDTKKTFIGRHNVYKFEWTTIEQGKYKEEWTVEPRIHHYRRRGLLSRVKRFLGV